MKPIHWKTVPGFPEYEVSDAGAVRTRATGHIKTPSTDRHGYARVQLSQRGRPRCQSVHTLVALAFIGPRRGNNVVNHVDGNKTNNRPGNLEYATYRQNSLHAHRAGLVPVRRGAAHPSTRLTDNDIRDIFNKAAAGTPRRELENHYSVGPTALWCILSRESWRHVYIPAHTLSAIQYRKKHRNAGAVNPLAKLDPEKVIRVFSLAKQGRTLDDIATHMGCSHATISLVLHRHTWTHVVVPVELLPLRTASGRIATIR